MDEPSAATPRCPWCSEPVREDATTCPACGAVVAQRESIGDLVIPGVTSVHPALEAYDAQPLHIPGPSTTQGFAAGALAVAASGGVTGIAALGGIAAVAAAEYLGARRTDPDASVDLDAVGRPSEATRRMLDRIAREREPGRSGDEETAPSARPGSGESPGTGTPEDMPPAR